MAQKVHRYVPSFYPKMKAQRQYAHAAIEYDAPQLSNTLSRRQRSLCETGPISHRFRQYHHFLAQTLCCDPPHRHSAGMG